MTAYFLLLIFIPQQIYSRAALNMDTAVQDWPNNEPQCMSVIQTLQATRNLCSQKNNTTLWQEVIDCHTPISEEFLRSNGEAQCPALKHVQDPTDTRYSIQDVFLNICGLFEGNFLHILETGSCFIFGKRNPHVISHSDEVAQVKSTWGNDVPCNIGKCILGLGII